MRERTYKYIEHTADIAFQAWGNGIEEAFKSAALALTDVLTDVDTIERKKTKNVKAQGREMEELLVAWLDELVYIFDVSNLVFSDFDIKIREEGGEWKLRAKALGEPFNPSKHPSGTEVKGVSYYGLKIWKEKERKYVRVILDV